MGYVIDITKQKPPTSVGNKALNIRRLANIGMRIPKTFAINWRAYHQYISDDAKLIDDLKSELAKIIEPDKTYAVRSSANIADSLDRSFAGQFKSVLHVQGVDNILQAAWSVWSSAQTPALPVCYFSRSFARMSGGISNWKTRSSRASLRSSQTRYGSSSPR